MKKHIIFPLLYSTKYVFGEIVAVDQLDGDEVVADGAALSVPVSDDLLCMDAKATVKEEATHIVLMSGSDVANEADVEVIALEAETGDKFTVTFLDATGVAIGTPAEVAAGTAISTLIPATDPTKAKATTDKLDWAFVGWYTDEALTTKLDKAATVTANMTLYPKFANVYIVGDTNLDGTVNMVDYNAALYYYKFSKNSNANVFKIGTEIPNTVNSNGSAALVGDDNLDGTVNMVDYNAALYYYKFNKNSNANVFKIGTELEVVKD